MQRAAWTGRPPWAASVGIVTGALLALAPGCGATPAPLADDAARGDGGRVDGGVADTGEAPDPDLRAAGDDAGPRLDASADAREDTIPPLSDSGSDAEPVTCPNVVATKAGTVQTPLVGETSGLAASRTQPDLLWAHNDSGGAPEIYALSPNGAWRGTYRLVGAIVDDWEDIAVGPGPTPGIDYVYVGDIGDNSVNRASVVVYRFPEPQVPTGSAPVTVDVTGVEAIKLVYPTTIVLPPPLPSFGGRNAESLFVDPVTADLFLVTKSGNGPEEVYRSPAPQDLAQPRKLTKVATFTIGSPQLPSKVDSASAADISPSGDEIVVRTESTAFIWRRPAGTSVAAAFASVPCVFDLLSEPNGEAITFDSNKVLFTLSEGGFQPIYRYQR